MKSVFINGEAGTTGLKIYKRLEARDDIKLISISPELRKDPDEIKKCLDMADVAFLCLPDEAAIEAVRMVENPDTIIIDTSTAHRTAPGWSYGFPELSEAHHNAIKNSKRITVPGCHASGFIALIYPLTEAGILPAKTELTCFSLTGYSGGGKKMIAEYENGDRTDEYSSPRIYATEQRHKHLKEMRAISRLVYEPHFTPVVADYFSGMLITIPLFARMLSGANAGDITNIYKNKYRNGLVRYCDSIDSRGFISSGALTGLDQMKITVAGNDERITLYAQFDNLGKGASGAAVECMNIALGIPAKKGLTL